MIENINMKGIFSIQIKDAATGSLIESFEEPNLVVDTGKVNTAQLLGGHSSGGPITKIGVGTNATSPALTDTALTGSFSKAINGVSYPATGKIQISFSLDAGEANGMNISEFGLLTASNVLIARKTRAAIAKTSAIVITGLWTLSIN